MCLEKNLREMSGTTSIPPPPPTKMYGKRVFFATCIFSAITIALVMWDEKQQRERRQVSVKYRMLNQQQQSNMEDYKLQKQKYEEYKESHS
uniref:Transmembrane protein n=1 Tax=Strongyloides venezuelensis TaxID=75913 RepID=A0A0K0EYH9_STRVS